MSGTDQRGTQRDMQSREGTEGKRANRHTEESETGPYPAWAVMTMGWSLSEVYATLSKILSTETQWEALVICPQPRKVTWLSLTPDKQLKKRRVVFVCDFFIVSISIFRPWLIFFSIPSPVWLCFPVIL